MKILKIWSLPIMLLLLVLWLQVQPDLVEYWYAQGVYPGIGITLRWIFGWIPFSIGDIGIGLFGIWLLYKIIKFISYISKNKNFKAVLAGTLQKVTLIIIWGYVMFHLLWGLNYYRLGSAHLLAIQPSSYTTSDADSLVMHLQNRIMVLCTDSAAISLSKTADRKILKHEAEKAYGIASKQYPFLTFNIGSLKPNLLGPLQSYTGYGGYLFPFTGEAQVNFYGPSFTMPFTVCHEMAHQIGFGTESEANLVGFLAARSGENAAFRYSAYAGVHQYALSELYIRDSMLAKIYIDSLPSYYVRDRKELRKFSLEHQSFLQPVLNSVYNFYLLSNNQPAGLDSYNYVVAWLIAYAKKFGWDAL
jgi:hypothetical protein